MGWCGLDWFRFRMKTFGELLGMQYSTIVSHKMLGIFQMATELVGYRVVLNSIELVSQSAPLLWELPRLTRTSLHVIPAVYVTVNRATNFWAIERDFHFHYEEHVFLSFQCYSCYIGRIYFSFSKIEHYVELHIYFLWKPKTNFLINTA
jgi:hypothetical protein